MSLNHLADSDLPASATANLVAHACWVQMHTPGMYVAATDDLVLADSNLPCDTFNLVCGARLTGDRAHERIGATVDHFARVGHPFCWWVSPGDQPRELGKLLIDAGLQPAETELAMAADLSTLGPGEPLPDGLRIQRVRTRAQIQDFAAIVAANWTPPDPEVLRFYALAAPALLRPNAPLWQYVGYLEDLPVATAELAVGGGVVGLYAVCTLAAYRRRGYGAALTRRPLEDAYALGFRTAILQAASAGVGIYTRLGFAPFGEVTEYKPIGPWLSANEEEPARPRS